MKRSIVFLTAILTLTSANVLAGHSKSILHLSLFDNASFKLVIDDRVYDAPSGEVTIHNLKGGNRFIKVIKRDAFHWGIYAREQVIFAETVHIERGCEIFAEIDHHDDFVIYNKSRIRPAIKKKRLCEHGCIGHCVHLHSAKICRIKNCRRHILSPSEFHELEHVLRNQWFDSSRKRLAKQAIVNNHITPEQLRDMLLLFDFEHTRVKVAKFAYKHMCDVSHFYVVYDAFDFQHSVNEMNRFIKHREVKGFCGR